MIHSPNTVLAKYLKDVIDVIQPRLEINKPREISFYVGTNINGAPHIGTYLVQSFAFVIAQKIRDKFNLPVKIVFGIHDNISFDSKVDSEGFIYHRTYHHALGNVEINRLIEEYYSSYFKGLKAATGISYIIEVYSDKQATRDFRENFLKTLNHVNEIRWCVAPSSGFLQIRIPCPKCSYSERDAAHTKLTNFDGRSASFKCQCLEHGSYEAVIAVENDTYIDLNTLYRNIVKEFSMIDSKDELHVVIKGGDWVYSTETIDWALGILGYIAVQTPMRIFLPQVVTATGAKLSKSLISEGHESVDDIPEWMINIRKFKELYPNYLDKLLQLTETMMTDPRHVFRSYSYKEIKRLLTEE
jgi:5-hydroxyisourate hydrolase-like protein (transthyretin family)